MLSPDERRERFKALLDSRHKWPCDYLFKFIVKKDVVDQACAVFEGEDIVLRESSGGKYVSLTLSMYLESADEVLDIYARAADEIPGVIAL